MKDGEVNNVQNLSWGGAMATDVDDPVPANFDPLDIFNLHKKNVGENNWGRRFDECVAKGYPYSPTPKVIVQLGGNDIVIFYETLETVEAMYLQYLLLRLVGEVWNFPATLAEFYEFSQNRTAWWFWAFESKSDGIVEGMKPIIHYLLDAGPTPGFEDIYEERVRSMAIGSGEICWRFA